MGRLQEVYGISRQQVFRKFHSLLVGAASKWYWLIENQAKDFDFIRSLEKCSELFTRLEVTWWRPKCWWTGKKGITNLSATMSRTCTFCNCKLKQNIAYDEFTELLKDNTNSQMGGLLLTSPIRSPGQAKRGGLRVGRILKNNGKPMQSSPVNEIQRSERQYYYCRWCPGGWIPVQAWRQPWVYRNFLKPFALHDLLCIRDRNGFIPPAPWK